MMPDCRLFKLSRTKKAEKFPLTCVVPTSLAARCVIYHNNRAAIRISCYCGGVVRRAD